MSSAEPLPIRKSNHEWAEFYRSKGLHVFPLWPVEAGVCSCPKGAKCKDAGKHPIPSNGFQAATTDQTKIDNWWAVRPTAGIGLRTGAVSGVDVLDVDTKSGGPDSLVDYERENGGLPLTPAETTGSGGRHYFFKHLDGLRRRIGFLPGLDALGDDGFVVVTPSLHRNGQYYGFDKGRVLGELELAEWPAALETLLTATGTDYTADSTTEVRCKSPKGYIRRVVESEKNRLMGAAPGERHDTLFKVAACLGNYVGDYLTDVEAEHVISDIVQQWEGQVSAKSLQTIRDGIKKGMENPKVLIPMADLSVLHTALESADPVDPETKLPKLPAATLNEYLEGAQQGDADLLAHLYRGRLYCSDNGRDYFVWQEHRWVQVPPAYVRLLVSLQVSRQHVIQAREYNELAAGMADEAEADKLRNKAREHSRRSQELRTWRYVDGVLKLAHGRLLLPPGWKWDSDPMLLGVSNGVIDLTLGQLRDGKPSDRIMTYCPIEYKGLEEPAPLWEQTLGQIFVDQPEMVPFLQRLLGYGITGHTSENVMAVFWGAGRNGKDTIIETLGRLLGGVVGSASRDVFLGGRHDSEGKGGAATPHLMALRGKRVVWCAETGAQGKLNAEQVKAITGGNMIHGRRLYGDDEEFEPTHLPILVTNEKPAAPPEDTPLWDRLILVSFNMRFVDDPKEPHELKKDITLKERLKAEASGILAWLVRGCLEWQKPERLARPACVLAATAEYHKEQDLLGQFMEEYVLDDPKADTPAIQLYKAYCNWLEFGQGYRRVPAPNAVGRQMAKKAKSKRGSSGMVYVGLKLRVTPDEIMYNLGGKVY